MVVHTPFLPRLDAIKSWKLFQYSLPMSVFSDRREGLILQTTFEDATCGWGEIAPLPGRSLETFQMAKEQLLKALHHQLRSPPYPSVAFGLESALTPYKPPTATFPLWALLAGDLATIQKKADRALQEGFTAIKVKVAHLSCKEATDAIQPLIGTCMLRIDVNQAWSFEEATRFFSQFPKDAITCIEEPTYELNQLHAFAFPFALDESLNKIPFTSFSQMPNLTTLIVKPTLAGGSYALEILKHLGKKILFTAAFESGIGTIQIANLVHKLNSYDYPLGLDTYRFLEKDVLKSPLQFSNGNLHPPSDLELNSASVTEIANG